MIRQRKPLQPGKPLERKTRIQAKKQVDQSSSLSRGEALSRGPVKPRKRPAVTQEEKDSREVVKKRSLVGEVRMCEITIPGVCTGRATDFHHRKNRSQGGTWEPVNGLAACRRCHSTVTDTRGEYYANGWCVESHQDPALTPVLYRGRWVLLTDEGGVIPAEKGAAA